MKQPNRESVWPLLIGLGTVLLLGVVVTLTIKSNVTTVTDNIAANGYPPPLLTQSTPLNATPTTVPVTRYPTNYPHAKQTLEQAEVQTRVAALQSPLPLPGLAVLPTFSPGQLADIPRRTAGAGVIVEGAPPRFHAAEFLVVNEWRETKGDKSIRVYAGVAGDGASLDMAQGAIRVEVRTPDSKPLPEGGTYLTPTKAGPVWIVDAQGEQLTLVAEDGSAFFFNVASQKFISPGPPMPVKRAAGSGILVESGASMFLPSQYAIQNQWYKDVGGKRVTVFTGSEPNLGGKALLVVALASLQNPTTLLDAQTYVVPVEGYPLRIFDVDGDQLILVSGGAKFIFDVATRQFVFWPDIFVPVMVTPVAVPPTPPPTLPVPTVLPTPSAAYP